MTLRTPIGWQRVSTHPGVIMTGSRSVKYRIISKLTDPEPTMTVARNSITGTPRAAKMRPTSWREVRCLLRISAGSPSPPR